jgi:hypothetical protein
MTGAGKTKVEIVKKGAAAKVTVPTDQTERRPIEA